MQMPRNGFDTLAAVARLTDSDTAPHRERWPSLAWVWDELDELRENTVDADDHASLNKEFEDALDERDAITEQRDALSEAVRLLLEPDPDMGCVQAVLMGGGL